ncbi:hypothetical protein AVEN_34151-1, partial [Araneus ventricosus]
MTPIYKSCKLYSVVSMNGFIYVIGGINEINSHPINDIERFDPRTGKLKVVSCMIPMFQSKTISAKGFIYVIKYNEYLRNPKMMVQVYDPASDKWLSFSVPSIFKPEITEIERRGHLYLIGYKLSLLKLIPCLEEYDSMVDIWIPMPYLLFIYRIKKAVVVKDVPIVHEENRRSGECTPPVYWVPENRTWHILQESSPLCMIHMSKICTITDPNVVKVIVK